MPFLLFRSQGIAKPHWVPAAGFGKQDKPKKAQKAAPVKDRNNILDDRSPRVQDEQNWEPVQSVPAMQDYLLEAMRASARTLTNYGSSASKPVSMVRIPASPAPRDPVASTAGTTSNTSKESTGQPNATNASTPPDQELARQIDELFGGSAPVSVINKIKHVVNDDGAKPPAAATLDADMASRKAELFATDVLQSLQQIAGSVSGPVKQEGKQPVVVEPVVMPPPRRQPQGEPRAVQAAEVVGEEQVVEMQGSSGGSEQTADVQDSDMMDSLIQAALAGFESGETFSTTAPAWRGRPAPQSPPPPPPPQPVASDAVQDTGCVSSAETLPGPSSSVDEDDEPSKADAAPAQTSAANNTLASAVPELPQPSGPTARADITHTRKVEQQEASVPAAAHEAFRSVNLQEEQQWAQQVAQLQSQLTDLTDKLSATEAALKLSSSQSLQLQSQLSLAQSQLVDASAARDALQREVTAVLMEKEQVLQDLMTGRQQHKAVVAEMEAKLSQAVQHSEQGEDGSAKPASVMSQQQVQVVAVTNQLMAKLLANPALSTQDKLSMSADLSQVLQLLLAPASDAQTP